MKIKLVITAVTLVTAIMATPAKSQNEPPAGQARIGQLQERLKTIFTEMKLEEGQREKLKEVFQEQGQKIREMMQDQNLSREEKGKKMKEISEAVDPKIKEILTPEQYAEWKKKQEEMKQQASAQAGVGEARQMRGAMADLGLSPEQQQKLKEATEGQRDKFREVFQDQSLSREQKMAKMKEMEETLTPKLKEILTPEQFEKYQVKRKEMQGRVGQRQQKN